MEVRKLTEKERLFAAFNREEIDRKPLICPGGMMNMITTALMDASGVYWPEAHIDPVKMADMAQASWEQRCFENVGVPFCMTVEAEAMGAQVTLGNTVAEPHVTEYAIKSVDDWETLPTPNVNEGRMAVVIEAIKILKSRDLPVPIVGNVVGPISVANSVQDAVTYHKEMRKKPEKMHAFMSFVTKTCADFAVEMAKAGADLICISDPSGTGEILGPKMFDEYCVTYVNEIIRAVKPYGVKTLVHICGQMSSVYEQMDKIEADALSFDAIVSLRKAKEALGEKHIIVGNISTFALETNNTEKAAALARNCAKGASDVIAPACGLGTGSPLENIQTLLKALDGEVA